MIDVQLRTDTEVRIEAKGPLKLGVLGGMGPGSTVRFLQEIVDATDAENDQDHIPFVMYMATQVPDRTDAYMHKGESPLESLVDGIEKLQMSGADFIAIPCNSAHLWYDEIVARTGANVLNMIELALEEINQGYRVGVIGTTLTVNSKLYEMPLSRRRIDVILPENQDFVMDQIRSVKSGNYKSARENMRRIADELVSRGATHILHACTEVSIALERNDISVPQIDPMRIMARKCVEMAGGKLKTA